MRSLTETGIHKGQTGYFVPTLGDELYGQILWDSAAGLLETIRRKRESRTDWLFSAADERVTPALDSIEKLLEDAI